jgi:hypothetical protein
MRGINVEAVSREGTGRIEDPRKAARVPEKRRGMYPEAISSPQKEGDLFHSQSFPGITFQELWPYFLA